MISYFTGKKKETGNNKANCAWLDSWWGSLLCFELNSVWFQSFSHYTELPVEWRRGH